MVRAGRKRPRRPGDGQPGLTPRFECRSFDTAADPGARMRLRVNGVARWDTARSVHPSTNVRAAPRGYTLVEILVVLVVMGLAAALVAPAFIPRSTEQGALQALTERARLIAIRRGEGVSLHIESSGGWRIEGLTSMKEGAIAVGRVADPPFSAVTLVFSPLGTSGPDVESTVAALRLGLNPLTCEAHAS